MKLTSLKLNYQWNALKILDAQDFFGWDLRHALMISLIPSIWCKKPHPKLSHPSIIHYGQMRTLGTLIPNNLLKVGMGGIFIQQYTYSPLIFKIQLKTSIFKDFSLCFWGSELRNLKTQGKAIESWCIFWCLFRLNFEDEGAIHCSFWTLRSYVK